RVGEGAFIPAPTGNVNRRTMTRVRSHVVFASFPVGRPIFVVIAENVGRQTSSGGAAGSFAKSAAVRLNHTRKLPVEWVLHLHAFGRTQRSRSGTSQIENNSERDMGG
ncbi:unnamed protein product, partial [Ectocarpus sp. 13 AM-2016]